MCNSVYSAPFLSRYLSPFTPICVVNLFARRKEDLICPVPGVYGIYAFCLDVRSPVVFVAMYFS